MNTSGLLLYQVEPAQRLFGLLSAGQNALDGSDCGIGKTYTACAVIRELNLPTLVICPQIAITSWNRVLATMGTEADVLNVEAVRTGKTPFGQWSNPRPPGPAEVTLVCNSCQRVVELDKPLPCPHHQGGLHCVNVQKKAHDYGKFRWHPAVKFIVVDEAHRFSGQDSLNSDMLIAVRRQGIKTLLLSATASDSPLGLKAIGYILKIHDMVGDNSFYRFAFRHGAKKAVFGGLYFAGDETQRRTKMKILHHEIFPSRGVRVKIEDLGAAFPESQITTELYDCKGAEEKVNALYEKMDEVIQTLNARRVLDQGAAVTELLRARQEVEILMVPVYEELTRQGLENGLSVALFMNFNQTLDELSRRLKTTCWVRGSMDPGIRQSNVDRFQADEERVILVNSQAGGVSLSLNDTRGQYPRLGLVSLGYSATQTVQVLGRLRRAGGKSKALYRIPLLANTVQEKIHAKLAPKLNQLDCLNDGDLSSTNLPLVKIEWPGALCNL